MSDEPTNDDTTPDASAPDDTSSSAPVLDTDTTQQVPVSAPATDTTDTTTAAPSGERRGVFVPRWLAIVAGVVVAVLLVGGGGFALGRSTADDDSSSAEVPSAPAPTPTRDDGPSTDDRPQVPDVPEQLDGAYLGVSVDPTSDATGVEIAEVAPDSPAADAGLEAGDVITEIDGEEITDFAELASVVAEHEPDDEVEITYERDGESTTVTVTLGERPAITNRPDDSGSGPSGSTDDEDSSTD